MKNIKLFVFTAVSAVSVVIIRCIQIYFLTEPDTGFFVEGMANVGTLLSVITVLIILFAVLMGLFVKQKGISLVPRDSLPLNTAAVMAGLAQITELFTYKPVLSDTVPQILQTLRAFSFVAVGAVFIYFGICGFINKKPKYEFSVIFVLGWSIRLISTFIGFTGMSNISENIYDILMLITILYFFLVYGKALCKIKVKNIVSLVFASGVAVVLFAAVSAVPVTLMFLMGKNYTAHTPFDSPATSIFIAIYVVVYLINVGRKSE